MTRTCTNALAVVLKFKITPIQSHRYHRIQSRMQLCKKSTSYSSKTWLGGHWESHRWAWIDVHLTARMKTSDRSSALSDLVWTNQAWKPITLNVKTNTMSSVKSLPTLSRQGRIQKPTGRDVFLRDVTLLFAADPWVICYHSLQCVKKDSGDVIIHLLRSRVTMCGLSWQTCLSRELK